MCFVEGFHFCWRYLRFETFHIHFAVAGNAYGKRLHSAIRVAQINDHIFQRVASRPLAVWALQVGAAIKQINKCLNRRCVRGIDNCCWRSCRVIDFGCQTDTHCFGVCRVRARGALHERIFANVARKQELFRCRPTHCPRHCRNNCEGQTQAVKNSDVCISVCVVTSLQAFVVDVERIRILHRKFASAQQTATRACLVSELVLNLIQPNGQVFVAAVQILHEQREHFFMRWR